MTIETYDELQVQVAKFLNRKNLADQIPTFIRLTEAQLRRDVRVPLRTEAFVMEVSGGMIYLPKGFAGLVSVAPASGTLVGLTLEMFASLPKGSCGHYALDGDKLLVDAVSGPLSVRYKTKFCPLSKANRANWLLCENPDAYLYGSLMQAAPYLEDDARIQVWDGLYGSAVDAINREAIEKQQAPLRAQAGNVV